MQGSNAEEARTWIEAWRNGGSSAGAQQESNGATPEDDEGGLPLVSDVGEGPLTWLQKLRVPWAKARAWLPPATLGRPHWTALLTGLSTC